MRLIDADALIEFCEERWIPLNIDAVNMQPTIQPVATDTNVGDTISRQAAIDEVMKYGTIWMEYNDAMSKDEIAQIALNNAKSTMIRILKDIQPEPAILLSWVEKYIEWLKSFDNEFANLEAAHILAMVHKWGDEQNERTD